MSQRPSGAASTLPAPFSTTCAFRVRAISRQACRRSAWIFLVSTPRRRPASAGCGVSSVGLARSRSALRNWRSLPMRLNASASSTDGVGNANARPSKSAARVPVPRPGPMTITSAPESSAALAVPTMSSRASESTLGCERAAKPTRTRPAPTRSAARPASRGAPIMPAVPPTMATVPKMPLWTFLRRRRKASGSAAASAGHISR